VCEDELLETFEAQQRGAVERAYLRLSASALRCEAWLIRWPPGSVAPLHDHGRAHGVAQVLAGTLHEIRFLAGNPAPQVRDWNPEQSIELARGICHEVRNLGPHTAYSVHVYAPRLERMTFYDRGARGELRPVRQERSNEWQTAAQGIG
jgi:predicted metal-dependent enzyme (double-stranded beta helix superfamily)